MAPCYVGEVAIDQQKLLAYGLSAQDAAHARAQQNIVLPADDQKIGALDFLVVTNASPVNVASFNALPIKQVGNTVVLLHCKMGPVRALPNGFSQRTVPRC
jgi:multidrug efflux pump subunit AcrB